MTPEESFEKNVGDDKLFPNHTDKDIWFSGYTQCQQDMADKKYTKEDMRQVFEYGKTLEPFDCFEDFINSLNKQD